eukprot:6079257-Amphidinium_carterae.1
MQSPKSKEGEQSSIQWAQRCMGRFEPRHRPNACRVQELELPMQKRVNKRTKLQKSPPSGVANSNLIITSQ